MAATMPPPEMWASPWNNTKPPSCFQVSMQKRTDNIRTCSRQRNAEALSNHLADLVCDGVEWLTWQPWHCSVERSPDQADTAAVEVYLLVLRRFAPSKICIHHDIVDALSLLEQVQQQPSRAERADAC